METKQEGAGFSLGAEFFVGLKDNLDVMAQSAKKSLRDVMPLRYPVGNVATLNTGAGNNMIMITNNTPAAGRIWEVNKVALFGNDDHTAVSAVTATIYGGPETGTQAPGDWPSVIAAAVTIPYVNLIGDHKVWMGEGEKLYAYVYGLTGAQQIGLVAFVSDYPIWAREAMSQ